jgi:hypothetical protein
MENIESNNTVYYELYSQKFGAEEIQEPKGWENDNESFTRDTDSRGITSKVDIDLEFFGNASSYLKNIYDVLGVEEKVIITKYEKNRFTLSEEWTIKYVQELDLTTYKIISRTGNVTVGAREGGLFSDIKNRESDEYDLLDNLSADEVDLGSLKTEVFQPLGRKLFVESRMEGGYTGYRINGFPHDAVSSTSDETSRAIPLEISYSSNPKDLITPFSSDVSSNLTTPHTLSYEVGEELQSGDMFFFRAEQDISLSLKLELLYKIVQIQSVNSSIQEFSINLIKTQKVNESDLIKEVTPLTTFTDFTLNEDRTYNDTFPATLLKDESLALVFTFKSTYAGGLIKGYVNFYLNILKSVLIIQDTTAYEDDITTSRCIKPLVFFDRIVAKITGKTGLVKSSIFEKQADGTDGEYEYMVIDNGLFARGFPDVYPNGNDEDQRIQLKSSFKTAFESFNYIEPLCWFTEIVGSTEYIRIEKATYTQQNFISIKLGSVDKIEYESSKLDYFSKIEIGHDRSLEYEEINGLDETNGKSEFTTFVTKNVSVYSAVSKFRTDAVGYELTRRLPFELYPKEDSKRDNDIWMHDAYKLPSGVITHKKWDYTGRFTSKPIGIYDPDTAWNLWLSPMNRLYYGHSYSIKRGLYHFPDKKIRFNSSNANQNLITEKDGFILSENGSITISDIPQARVEATKINFTFKMTQEIDNMFKGFETINNLQVPNYFGLVEYLENGIKKYGRLVKLESSEEAKITLIKARL